MEKSKYFKITGYFIIGVSLLIILSQAALMLIFGYPDVLGKSLDIILEKYHQCGKILSLTWFCFAFGTFMTVPVSLMFHKIFNNKNTPFLIIGTTFGIIAGLCYVIGINRWILLDNYLAECYAHLNDFDLSISSKESIKIIFKSFDLYAGNGFGETIAPISHGLWLIILGISMLNSRILSKWISVFQIIFGVIIFTRPFEYLGMTFFADFSDIGLMIWLVFLIFIGVKLIIARPEKGII